ncbi:MAG: XRE family transcriptional regulator [Actinomycetota bacterium]|nr:XRE family transcriptional regulator [Actinomycetota bacterium]
MRKPCLQSILRDIEPLERTTHGGAHAGDAGLGEALRRARKARGLSLAQVAEATRISRSLLSLIETGRSDITIGRLSRLAQLYDVRLADLVPEPRHADPIVVRADDRRGIHYTSEGIDIEILVPEGPRTVQALLATFSPRAAMEDFIVTEREQFTYVLEGRLETEFADGRTLELNAGDSATYFSGEGGHRHTNLADTVTRMVVVAPRPPQR